MTVELADVPDAVRRLKEQGYVRFVDMTVVDRPEQELRFELHYVLYSMDSHQWQRLRTSTSERAPSITAIFPGANAYERELYDMYGVQFDGHPNLTRILMPDDWVGHPLRRDEPLGGEEVDFTTRREPHGD